MLGVKLYTREYVDACRARVDEDVAAFRAVAAAGNGDGVLAAFEQRFFNEMVVVLDRLFVHRLRGVEGKDGNPLNEVRVMCESLLTNDGLMGTDPTIKLVSSASVLKYQPGDRIALREDDFVKLSRAFFDEMERRFV